VTRNELQSRDKAAAEFWLAFYRKVVDNKTQTRVTATITAEAVEGPNFTGRVLTIELADGRTITVQHSIPDKGNAFVDLSEGR
jgi:hypothetical protein